MSRESIFDEIASERARQDDLFGGAEHDDKHSLEQWLVILMNHVGLACWDGSPDDVCLAEEATRKYNPCRFRKQMIRVAAVAVAALEVFDRKMEASLSAAPGAPDPLAPLRSMLQRAANQEQVTYLLMQDYEPDKFDGRPHVPYGVNEEQASAWELVQAVERISPVER